MEITPQSRMGALLDAYPGLAERLARRVPAFARLLDPLARRTIARIATVAQAAAIAGMEPEAFLEFVRGAAGAPEPAAPPPEPPPDWARGADVRARLDADEVIAAGEKPLARALAAMRALRPGDVLELTSPFPPLPLTAALRREGHACWTRAEGPGRFVTLVRRAP